MSSEYPVPKRRSIVEDAAEALRARIAAQVWKSRLPGERVLAETLQVGRDTLRSALRILQEEGLVGSSEQGARREIFFQSKKKPRKDSHEVAILTPWSMSQIPATTLLEIDTLRGLLFNRGIALKIVTAPCFHLKNPARVLSRCLSENNADLWILYRSTQAMQRWFQDARCRCLLRGHQQPGITLNKLDTDWEATAYHSGIALSRAGHTEIGFMAPNETLQGIEAARRGLQKALSDRANVRAISEPGDREGLCRVLARLYKTASPPTALVVTQPREAATTLTWLAANGIAVPSSVSLVCLADDPNLDVLVPSITRYTIPSQALARLLCRHILRLLSDQPSRRETPLFMPEFLPGETIAPVTKNLFASK